MRIAMLIDVYGNFAGGGQYHVHHLSEQLKQSYSTEVDILSQPRAAILQRFFWSAWVIPQALVKNMINPYDLIHSHGYIAGLSGKILSVILGIPVIHTVHGSNLMDLKDNSWKGRLEKFLLTGISYDAQISVSKSFIAYPNKTKRIEIIPNGIKIKNIENRIKNSGNKIVLLFVGRLEKVKGVDLLLKALAQVKTELFWELRIIGDGGEKEKLKTLASELGITDRTTFLGQKTGKVLVEEYLKADLFILPSLSEGQPITVLEAWAYGLPVLATAVGHNPYTIENGIDGFLVKPGNVDDLTQALKQAIKKRTQWSKMGAKGQDKVKQYYNWKEIAEKTYKVYEQVLTVRA